MLILLSPAKRLDFESPINEKIADQLSKPRLMEDTQILVKDLQKMSAADICQLMKVSDAIGELNYQRYQNFDASLGVKTSRPAITAFQGDVYRDLETEKYSAAEFEFAQTHVRTLSGLYGVLRPLDLMHPYRLEMHTKFATARGKDLYHFWGTKIADVLNQDLAELRSSDQAQIINLASQQYFQAVDLETLNADRIITPVFKEKRGSDYKIVALYAKLARGTMTNFVIKNKFTDPEDLKGFNEDNYQFTPQLSSENEWVFVRG